MLLFSPCITIDRKYVITDLTLSAHKYVSHMDCLVCMFASVSVSMICHVFYLYVLLICACMHLCYYLFTMHRNQQRASGSGRL